MSWQQPSLRVASIWTPSVLGVRCVALLPQQRHLSVCSCSHPIAHHPSSPDITVNHLFPPQRGWLPAESSVSSLTPKSTLATPKPHAAKDCRMCFHTTVTVAAAAAAAVVWWRTGGASGVRLQGPNWRDTRVHGWALHAPGMHWAVLCPLSSVWQDVRPPHELASTATSITASATHCC